jgi:hypothetical protein
MLQSAYLTYHIVHSPNYCLVKSQNIYGYINMLINKYFHDLFENVT